METRTETKYTKNPWWRRSMEFVKIKKESEKVCYYCGKEITEKDELTVDHVIPVSKGGADEKENLVIACKTCNKEKSNLDVEKYLHFVHIINSIEQNNDNQIITDMLENLRNTVNGFNDILKTAKKRKSVLERKRTMLLQSMMYEKFNVVRGYYYAKSLQELTEELYNISLTVSQMSAVVVKINPSLSCLNNLSSESIKNTAVKDMRNAIISNYYNSREDEPKEQPAPPEQTEKDGSESEKEDLKVE